MAADLGVDLATVQGTGPEGSITRADIEAAAKKAKEAPVAPAVGPRSMREAIAAAMARSKREIPHYYLQTHIDMSGALQWLEAENAKRSVTDRILPIALLIKATALAVRQVPELNGTWIQGVFKQSEPVHVGVAISLRDGGLVAPAIHHVERLPLNELMSALMDLVTRARSGGLRSSELSDPTLTVSNLGEMGVETMFGIIYPPQSALVGFGKISQRPWVSGGKVEPRPIVSASLSADHRVSDGHRGGLFLAALERLLQQPGEL